MNIALKRENKIHHTKIQKIKTNNVIIKRWKKKRKKHQTYMGKSHLFKLKEKEK
jgi:hypothetical protein